MNAECNREQEVLELARAGRWPESCDDEVRAHVAQCSPCSETARIATLMTADLHAAMRTVRVPTSGVVWWRAQRRAREEAAHAAARAVTLVQAIFVAIGVAVALGMLGADNLRRALTFSMSAAVFPQWSVPLLIAFAATLAIAPVAVYFAVSRD